MGRYQIRGVRECLPLNQTVRRAAVAVFGITVVAPLTTGCLHGSVATAFEIAHTGSTETLVVDRAHVPVVAGGAIRRERVRRAGVANSVA